MTGVDVVSVTPTSGQFTVMLTGPDVLFAATVSASAVIDAVVDRSGQLSFVVTAVTVTCRLCPCGIEPKLQVRTLLAIEQAPAFGPLGTQVSPPGSGSVMTTPFDVPGPFAVTTTL
jgi:hypothetical protein